MGELIHYLGRLLSQVEVLDNGCWNYTGKLTKAEYVQSYYKDESGRQHHRGHTIVYAALVGPLELGMVTDHLCDNRACLNPDHLDRTTVDRNWHRGLGIYFDNKTTCLRGHELITENIYKTTQGYNACRQCERERTVRRKASGEYERAKAKRAERQMWLDKANAIINRK